jgi:transcriptional regulator
MYLPRFNVMDADEVRPLVAAVGSAELITVGDDGFPQATRLPVLWDEDQLLFHMAIANPHWRAIQDGSPALAVVTGPEAYVSPSWYPAKAEHGRVVPTWNYSAVQFTGLATVRRSAEWLEEAVNRLTEHHEGLREEPWQVTDAPASYISQQLRAIVGIELSITAVEAKAKRSQNRSVEDRAGVVAGLLAGPGADGHRMAAQMQADLDR